MLSLFVVANFAAEDLPQEKDLICDICQEIVSFLLLPASRAFQMDQVTQFDAFLTSDPTEAQITEWVKSICHMLAEVRSLKARKVVLDNRNQGMMKPSQPSCLEAKDILQPNQILNRPDLETTCNLILTAEIPAIIGIPELSSPFAVSFATGKIIFSISIIGTQKFLYFCSIIGT